MNSHAMVWAAVTLIGLGNLYMGRLIAAMGLPRRLVGETSWKVMGLFALLWVGGLALLYRANGLQLTTVQACILSGCVLVSYIHHRTYFGPAHPPVPWDQFLNAKVHVITRICERHAWDTSSEESLQRLRASGELHFDGADYDTLMQAQSDSEYEMRKSMTPHIPRDGEGEIDYDRACAKEIVMLAGSLAGTDEYDGIVASVSQDYDMSGFDTVAYERLQWLAQALRDQWGLAGLYG